MQALQCARSCSRGFDLSGSEVHPFRFDRYEVPFPPAAVRLVVIPLQGQADLVGRLRKLASEVQAVLPPGDIQPRSLKEPTLHAHCIMLCCIFTIACCLEIMQRCIMKLECPKGGWLIMAALSECLMQSAAPQLVFRDPLVCCTTLCVMMIALPILTSACVCSCSIECHRPMQAARVSAIPLHATTVQFSTHHSPAIPDLILLLRTAVQILPWLQRHGLPLPLLCSSGRATPYKPLQQQSLLLSCR